MITAPVKLSRRLKAIADYIKNEEDIADIGTDHGYLPLYLIHKNPKRKVIFTDVNEGPLKKTQGIILKENPNADLTSFDIRAGDGLEPIDYGEVDTAVIAGMGGILIRDILKKDGKKTRSIKKLILQPRTAADKLRKWLVDQNYYIFDESLAYEKGRICEIICVNQNENNEAKDDAIKQKDEFKDELDYEFSPILLKKHDKIISNWLKRSYDTELKIEKSIKLKGGEKAYEKLPEIERRITKLEEILSEFTRKE